MTNNKKREDQENLKIEQNNNKNEGLLSFILLFAILITTIDNTQKC